MKLTFFSSSAKETQRLAKIIAALMKEIESPLVLALSGNLGAGKTIFMQGLAKGLGIEERIISPTFVIMKPFQIFSKESIKKTLWHIDCWRLEEKDFLAIGLKELLKDKENIVCLEWAERVKKLLPINAVWLKFEHGPDSQRLIHFFQKPC